MNKSAHVAVLGLIFSLGCAERLRPPAGSTPVDREGNVTATESNALVWGPGPGPKVMVAVVWGDPQNGQAGGEIYRFENGFTSPEHSHPFTERAVVIEGTFILRAPGQPERRLAPGSYFLIPADHPHSTGCGAADTCRVYNEVVPK